MSEKARGAIFNVLGDIEGLTVLDAYAGSGALGIEALSRGAQSVLALDNDRNAARTVRENSRQLGLGSTIKIVQQTVFGWSDANATEQFDLVFADPPYDDIHLTHVEKLLCHVKSGGILVLSWPGNLDLPRLTDAEQVARKPLGDIQLIFYRRK